MVSVMNEPHCHKKSPPVSQKLSHDYDMIKLQNQQFINNTLEDQLFADVLMF